MAPGYQPVGIKPSTSLVACIGARTVSAAAAPRRATATELLLPLATYRVAPSGLSATALVPLPKGKRKSGRQRIVSTPSSFLVSSTDTLSFVALATYRNLPPGLRVMPLGWSSTRTVLTCFH